MSSRNTCHQILIAAGRPGLAAVDERGVLLQELFAVGWDICGSFTRPQNAEGRRAGTMAGLFAGTGTPAVKSFPHRAPRSVIGEERRLAIERRAQELLIDR